jgi:hypothetical protein
LKWLADLGLAIARLAILKKYSSQSGKTCPTPKLAEALDDRAYLRHFF